MGHSFDRGQQRAGRTTHPWLGQRSPTDSSEEVDPPV